MRLNKISSEWWVPKELIGQALYNSRPYSRGRFERQTYKGFDADLEIPSEWDDGYMFLLIWIETRHYVLILEDVCKPHSTITVDVFVNDEYIATSGSTEEETISIAERLASTPRVNSIRVSLNSTVNKPKHKSLKKTNRGPRYRRRYHYKWLKYACYADYCEMRDIYTKKKNRVLDLDFREQIEEFHDW